MLEIALVGKYIELPDAYLSVTEALKHAAWAHEVDARIRWVDSERLTPETVEERLAGVAGVLVPGGFGHRGIEGKVLAARYARERRIPYLGLCLGLQCAVIELARHVLDTKDVNSTEFDMFTANPSSTSCPTSGTWRRRAARCAWASIPARLARGSKAAAVYGDEVIYERHRHRFEVNNRYRAMLEGAGMVLSGQSPDGRLVEIVELRGPPVVRRQPVPPRVQEPPRPAAPAVRRLRRNGARPARGSGAGAGGPSRGAGARSRARRRDRGSRPRSLIFRRSDRGPTLLRGAHVTARNWSGQRPAVPGTQRINRSLHRTTQIC